MRSATCPRSRRVLSAAVGLRPCFHASEPDRGQDCWSVRGGRWSSNSGGRVELNNAHPSSGPYTQSHHSLSSTVYPRLGIYLQSLCSSAPQLSADNRSLLGSCAPFDPPRDPSKQLRSKHKALLGYQLKQSQRTAEMLCLSNTILSAQIRHGLG